MSSYSVSSYSVSDSASLLLFLLVPHQCLRHIYLHEAAHVFPVQEHQLQSHAKMLESFKVDLENQQQSMLDSKKAKARDMEEHLQYLQHEVRWTQDFISLYDYIN